MATGWFRRAANPPFGSRGPLQHPSGSSGTVKVSWVFDVVSPFSYLSLRQLSRLPQAASIEYVPVLFAGILDHFGQLGNAEIASKRRFTYRFVLWRARRMGITMRMPPAHPFNPLPALRLIIAAGGNRRAVETVMDAVYLDGQDVAESDVIARLAHKLDITDPRAALSAPAVKQRLRDNTDWAIAHGVFGVPTFVIGGQIFWGHDTFDMVLDYLHDPAPFEDAQMRAADTLPIGVARAKASKVTPRA
jgi:2-hydroxychromene-2-carboxylate isomerase